MVTMTGYVGTVQTLWYVKMDAPVKSLKALCLS